MYLSLSLLFGMLCPSQHGWMTCAHAERGEPGWQHGITFHWHLLLNHILAPGRPIGKPPEGSDHQSTCGQTTSFPLTHDEPGFDALPNAYFLGEQIPTLSPEMVRGKARV